MMFWSPDGARHLRSSLPMDHSDILHPSLSHVLPRICGTTGASPEGTGFGLVASSDILRLFCVRLC